VETLPPCHAALEHSLTEYATVVDHHQASQTFAICKFLNFATAFEKNIRSMDHTSYAQLRSLVLLHYTHLLVLPSKRCSVTGLCRTSNVHKPSAVVLQARKAAAAHSPVSANSPTNIPGELKPCMVNAHIRSIARSMSMSDNRTGCIHLMTSGKAQ
jgi:hypothetical protein